MRLIGELEPDLSGSGLVQVQSQPLIYRSKSK